MGASLSLIEADAEKELHVFRKMKAAHEEIVKEQADIPGEELYSRLQHVLEQAVEGMHPSSVNPCRPGSHEDNSAAAGGRSGPNDYGGIQVPKRRFGRTELQMPIITCGGMRMQQTWTPSEDFSFQDVEAECQANFEAIVDRAMSLGINHFETARGYGCSEIQYGRALKRHCREDMIVQTKVRPFEDPEVFRATLETSLKNIDTHVDLFGFHGINKPEHLEWIMREGGCLEIIREYQRAGKVRFVGFSTHAPTPLIVKSIETGVFDYVNLHYHYIGSYTSSGTATKTMGNLEAIRAASAHDMGIFIISPSDKGGMLYKPPKKLMEACRPLSPLAFNDLWLWLHEEPQIHTLVVGAARPSDFDEHVEACKVLMGCGQAKDKHPAADLVKEIDAKLQEYWRCVWGEEVDTWWHGLLNCYETKTGVHVVEIVWLWALVKAYGLHLYGVTQYNKLEQNRQAMEKDLSLEENISKSFDWVPGYPFDLSPDDRESLASELPSERRAEVLEILAEAHQWMGKDTQNKVAAEVGEQRGWRAAYDMQPDIPFPERAGPH